MRQTSKVLTTTNQQGLSPRQASNARANIGAQVLLDTSLDEKVSLEPVYDETGEVVVANSIKVDSDYEAGSEYVVVDNDGHTVDLAMAVKNSIDAIPAPANDGKLTLVINGVGHEFTADSNTDVLVRINDTTYALASESNDGLMSADDYTKLAGIEPGAQVNVPANWNAVWPADGAILNKPSEFPPSAHTHSQDDVIDLSDSLGGKVDKVDGKGLSTNDYSDAEKAKLGGIADGAQVNVQADWSADESDPAGILNRPDVYTKNEVYTKDEVDSRLQAHAVFIASVEDLPHEGDPDYGDASKTYYVGPKESATGDAYDVYVWNSTTESYQLVDESEISLEGYLHGINTLGTGNAVASISKADDDTVTVTMGTFAKPGDIPTRVSELDNDAGFITSAEVPEVTADALAMKFFSFDNSIEISTMVDPATESTTKVNFQLNSEFESTISPARPFDKVLCDTVISVPLGSGADHAGGDNVRGVLVPIIVPSGRIESISMFPEAFSGGHNVLYLGMYGNDADTINGAHRWLGVYGADMGVDSATFSFEGHAGDANIVGTMVGGLPYIVKRVYVDGDTATADVNGRAVRGEGATLKKFTFNWLFLAVVNTSSNGGTRCFGYNSPVGRIGSETYRKRAGLAWLDQFTQETGLFSGGQFAERLGGEFSGIGRLHSTDLAFPYIQFNIVK